MFAPPVQWTHFPEGRIKRKGALRIGCELLLELFDKSLILLLECDEDWVYAMLDLHSTLVKKILAHSIECLGIFYANRHFKRLYPRNGDCRRCNSIGVFENGRVYIL